MSKATLPEVDDTFTRGVPQREDKGTNQERSTESSNPKFYVRWRGRKTYMTTGYR